MDLATMGLFGDINNLNPGIALALTGALGYIFRQIPSRIGDYFFQKYSVNIQVNNQNEVNYNYACKWLIQLFPELKKHTQFVGWRYKTVVISDGSYTFMPDPLTIVFLHKYKIDENYSNSSAEVFIRIFGVNRKKYINDFYEFILNKFPNYELYTHIDDETENGGVDLPKKKWEDIYLYNKEGIIKILDNFKKNEKVYKEHSINYKLGILLYGQPGVGKSVTARAIAAYLNWDIYYVDLSCRHLPNVDKSVVLIEDIDCLVDSREGSPNKIRKIDNKNDGSEETKNNLLNIKLPLHTFLNWLDGPLSPTNVVIVASTNYIDRLDPALVRPGRFDFKFEIKPMDYYLATQMCDNFNISHDILEDIEFPCSPAIVQNKILMKINES